MTDLSVIEAEHRAALVAMSTRLRDYLRVVAQRQAADRATIRALETKLSAAQEELAKYEFMVEAEIDRRRGTENEKPAG